MTNRALLAITHMLEAISNIREDTGDGENTAFDNDRRLRQLVERNLEIISEASRRIPEQYKADHPEIPWRQVQDIGNILRHEYQRINADELRLVIEYDLDPLEEALEAMLAVIRKEGG